MKISLLPRTAFYTNNSALMLFLLVRSFLSFLRKTLFTYELYNVIKRYCWQFNIRQTLSLRFLTSPDTGPTNLVSNNFEIFTLLKDDFCSVRLLHSKMLEKSPSSHSHASSTQRRLRPLHTC